MDEKFAIAIVSNFKFLRKHFKRLFFEIRNVGKFDGTIVLITTLFCPTFLLPIISRKNKVKVLRFKRIKFSKKVENSLNNLETYLDPNRNKTKKFQWHKIHLFDERIKYWEKILYIDINMHIHHELNGIFSINNRNTFMARADAYPKYDRPLSSQFDLTQNLSELLLKTYDLSIVDYFQTGVMFFDTGILEESTKKDILKLVDKYPLSTTNEQGILNIYFIFHRKIYKELPEKLGEYITYFYWKEDGKKTIITKQNTSRTK